MLPDNLKGTVGSGGVEGEDGMAFAIEYLISRLGV